MDNYYLSGDKVIIAETYTWGGGRFAGREVVITDVQDGRDEHPDALIYTAQIDPPDGTGGIPLEPQDIAGYACTCRPGTGMLRHWGCHIHDSLYVDEED